MPGVSYLIVSCWLWRSLKSYKTKWPWLLPLVSNHSYDVAHTVEYTALFDCVSWKHPPGIELEAIPGAGFALQEGLCGCWGTIVLLSYGPCILHYCYFCPGQCSIAVARNQDQGNYCKRKNLIGACLLFQRFSLIPSWQRAWWHVSKLWSRSW